MSNIKPENMTSLLTKARAKLDKDSRLEFYAYCLGYLSIRATRDDMINLKAELDRLPHAQREEE